MYNTCMQVFLCLIWSHQLVKHVDATILHEDVVLKQTYMTNQELSSCNKKGV